MKNQKFTIGNANANAICLNVIVKQKSINKKQGIELVSNFKASFNVYVDRYVSVGQSLNRILKSLNFQIIQGKQSGKLNGLNLRYPFTFEVMQDSNVLFKSTDSQFDSKCGLTAKSQDRFFHSFAKQFTETFNNRTLMYMDNFENDSNYTMDMDAINFRSIMDTNIVDAIETLCAM